MWDRKEIKNKAKDRLRSNYWRMVLVALIATIVTTGMNSASRVNNVRNTYNSYRGINNYNYEEYYDDYDWDEDWDEDEEYDDTYDNETLNYEGKQLRYEYDAPATAESLSYSTIGGSDGPTSIFTAGSLGMGIGLSIILLILLIVFGVGFGLTVFLFNPLSVGGNRFFIRNMEEDAKVGELGFAFDHNYLNIVKTMFIYDVKLILWTLLLIVPGIVKGYEYRMVPYLLAENPEISTADAFAVSKRMMDGNKWDTFVYDLSFFLWNLLGAVTFGFANIFFVNPYYEQSNAFLYDAIKKQDEQVMQRREAEDYWRNLE